MTKKDFDLLYTQIVRNHEELSNLDERYVYLEHDLIETRNNINILLEEIKDSKQKIDSFKLDINEMKQSADQVNESTKELKFEIQDQIRQNENTIHAVTNQLRKIDQVQESVNKTLYRQQISIKASNEALWGQIFKDSITSSTWIEDKSFSPGRWAVGYQMLYVLYRILNDVKPKSILELGLGQSTHMIGQYASKNLDCKHWVVEHDSDWIRFMDKHLQMYTNSNLVQLELEERDFREEKVLSYKDIKDTFKKHKFNLILIDAPFGNDTNMYSRVDIVSMIPECLEKDFVILVDDYNRKGERNMVEALKEKLMDHGIEHVVGKYVGQKETVLIASRSYHFLSSL